jgi:hypothetical protein
MKHLHLSPGSQLIMIGSCHSIMFSSPPFLSLLWGYLTRMCLLGCAYRYANIESTKRFKLCVVHLPFNLASYLFLCSIHSYTKKECKIYYSVGVGYLAGCLMVL